MALHSSLTGTNAHKAYAWSYANSTAREGATGFASGDVGDLAYQQDDDSLWILTDDDPVTWQQVDYQAITDVAQTITAVHTLNPGSLGSALTLGANAEAFYKSANTERFCVSGNTDLLGSAILLHGKSHATLAGLTSIRFGGGSGVGSLIFQHYDGSTTNNLGGMDPSSNLTVGNNTWPSTGTRTISVRSGTAPSTMTDYGQIYAADITAGNCAIHCQAEGGAVIKLFQGAAVADATDATSVIARLNDLLARMRANGLIAT